LNRWTPLGLAQGGKPKKIWPPQFNTKGAGKPGRRGPGQSV